MQSAIIVGAPKVTKMLKKFKLLWFLGVSLLPVTKAAAVPVQVLWQVPLNPEERYVLQLSREPGFGQFLIDRQVDGNGFNWDTPGEGVFHWRLLRPGKTEKSKEGSTFVSGSFVAVEAGKRERPARISWQAVQGAERYKLYLVDATGRVRTLVSSTTSVTMPPLKEAVMVEVVPQSGGQRMFRDYHFQPSLKFDGGKEPASAEAHANPASPVATPLPAASDNPTTDSPVAAAAATPSTAVTEVPASQAAATPSPESTTVATPATSETTLPAAPSEPARRRRHLVYGMVFYEQDDLEFSKLEVDLRSTEGVTGAGGGFWLNPISGVIVSGQGGYHDHKGVMEQAERFPNARILLDQSRYTATLDLGFNVLAPFEIETQVLSLALTAGATQLPTLPLRFSSDAGVLPSFETRAYNLIGGSLAYGWLSDVLAVMLDGTSAQANEDATKLAQGRLMIDFYPSERFAILLGGYYRKVDTTRCDPDSAQCLAEGKVRTTVQETGAFVGLGAVFM